MTLRETILSVQSGNPVQLDMIVDGNDITSSYRAEANRINNELRALGVRTKNGRPPYSISKVPKLSIFYIINNMEK